MIHSKRVKYDKIPFTNIVVCLTFTNIVSDVPEAPGRPIAAKVWDTHAYIVWSEPAHDGNSPVRRFKIDCKPQGR